MPVTLMLLILSHPFPDPYLEQQLTRNGHVHASAHLSIRGLTNDTEQKEDTMKIVEEVTTMAEASAWLKKNFDDVSYKEVSNAKAIKSFIKDNKVSFPKLFK